MVPAVDESPTLPFPCHGEAEEWRPIPGYEGFYAVSSLGNVRSFHAGRGSGKRGGLLRPALSAGHLSVVLYHPDKPGRSFPVHQLVALAFIGPRPEGQEVRHGPNGALDNRASELCYGTPAENQADKVRDGTSNRGERQWQSRLTREIVMECRRRYAAGETQRALAREFGIGGAAMSQAITGAGWSWLPGAVPVDRARHGKQGAAHHGAKLTWEAVAEIRRRYAAGEMQRPLGAEFGVSQAVISKIVRGETWRAA